MSYYSLELYNSKIQGNKTKTAETETFQRFTFGAEGGI